MKRIGIVVMLAAGCIKRPYITPQEQCAKVGMLADGASISSGGSVGVATSGGRTAVATGSHYSEHAICRRAVTPAEQCEVSAAQASFGIKSDYGVKGRNLLIGVGWFVFLVPGLVLYLAFDSERDGVMEDAEAASARVGAGCGG